MRKCKRGNINYEPNAISQVNYCVCYRRELAPHYKDGRRPPVGTSFANLHHRPDEILEKLFILQGCSFNELRYRLTNSFIAWYKYDHLVKSLSPWPEIEIWITCVFPHQNCLHFFPRLPSVSCYPARRNGYVIFRP